MDFTDPHFAEPGWLWLAVLGPIALLGLRGYAARARFRQMKLLASSRFLDHLLRSVSPTRRRLKSLLLTLALAGTGLTLARPQWGRLPETVHAASEDILFVLDASRSMLAQDVRPNRLERAKLAMLDFLQTHPDGRVGLVVFAGQAFLQCPLTFDHEAFRESLLAVDANTIPVGGTDLGRALSEAMHAVENPEDRQVLLLLSDGEDLADTGMKVAEQLAKQNVALYAVGVGTTTGSEIPIRNTQGQADFVRDDVGRIVRTQLNEDTLRQVAAAAGGTYQRLGALGEGLVDIQFNLQTARARESRPTAGAGVDRFYVPLALVIVLLVTESLIGTRRSQVDRSGLENRGRSSSLLAVLLVGGLLSTGVARAEHAFTDRDAYNQGTAKLAEGDLTAAEMLLYSAVTANDDRIQPVALYNLGLVRFGLGVEALKKGPDAGTVGRRAVAASATANNVLQEGLTAMQQQEQAALIRAYLRGRGARKELKEAMKALQEALNVYGNVLSRWQRASGDFDSSAELRPKDPDAAYNANVVDRHIAKLVDSIQQMQSIMQGMGQQMEGLEQLLKALRGMIPDKIGNPGPGEDGDDWPEGLEPGTKEGQGREGDERPISPEDAQRLLDSFQLDRGRALPMGFEESGKPQDQQQGRNW